MPNDSLPPETPKNLNRFSSHGTFGNDAQASASHAEHANMMWGLWRKTADWQDKLHKSAAHKALNIPEEDVITSTNITHSGLGWKELAIIALAGAAGLFGYSHYCNQKSDVEVQDHTYDPVKLKVKVTPKDGGGYETDVTPVPKG
jgi:hypothetical protein